MSPKDAFYDPSHKTFSDQDLKCEKTGHLTNTPGQHSDTPLAWQSMQSDGLETSRQWAKCQPQHVVNAS